MFSIIRKIRKYKNIRVSKWVQELLMENTPDEQPQMHFQ